MALSMLIKYEGDNSNFIWKFPKEDFNCLTQIVVHESQEAIFVKDGTIYDILGPGRYKLNAENIPLLSHALNWVTGISIVHCEVYFVNLAVQMSLKWGTDSKVRFVEPTAQLPIELGASGEMNLRVVDSKKLFVKLIGTMKGIAWEQSGKNFTKSIQNAFKPMISNAIKTTLSNVIKESNIDIVEIDNHLDKLSIGLQEVVNKGFIEYGLSTSELYVTNIVLPENDPNFIQLKELHTAAFTKKKAVVEADVEATKVESKIKITKAERELEIEKQTTDLEITKKQAEQKIIISQAEAEALKAKGIAEAEIMKAKGYTEKDVLQADVQKAYAEGLGKIGSSNGGAGNGLVGDIVGLGVGLAAAGEVSKKIGGIFNENNENSNNVIANKKQISCPKCGTTYSDNIKFCNECGTKLEVNAIKCPHCGDYVKNAKFCSSCGKKLINTCPKCGNTNSSDSKFCSECGEKL